MKNQKKFLLCVLMLICSFMPVTSLILFCFKYSISLFNYTFFATLSALIFIVSTVIISKSKETEQSKTLKFFIIITPLMSLANAFVYLSKSRSATVAVCMAICFFCSAVVAEKTSGSKKAKIFSVVSSGLLSVPLLIFSVLLLVFDSFGVNTVIDTIPSPDGTYYAEIVDSDQGALGGDTVVNIHKNSRLNLLIMTVNKTPQRVYIGGWREYETMDIYWEDEMCLVINSKKYTVII